MVTLIVSLPLCLNHLGAERFGMMETVISLIMIMSFADLGLGFGLQNRLAELEKSEDKTELKKAISSTFWILIGFTSFLSLIFFIAYPNIAWDHIFNVKSELAISEAGPTVIVFFFVLSFRFHFL